MVRVSPLVGGGFASDRLTKFHEARSDYMLLFAKDQMTMYQGLNLYPNYVIESATMFTGMLVGHYSTDRLSVAKRSLQKLLSPLVAIGKPVTASSIREFLSRDQLRKRGYYVILTTDGKYTHSTDRHVRHFTARKTIDFQTIVRTI